VATPYRYTGQRWESVLGLYDYHARWYDPALGRFAQPDPLVPEPGNPQSLNRYAYTLNNPVRYNDPSGHAVPIDAEARLLVNPFNGNVMVRELSGSALYMLIAYITMGDASARDRLGQMPDQTGDFGWKVIHTHFQGLASIKGDAGFAPEFQDDHWYAERWNTATPESKQVGHFLTAVSMGFDGSWVLLCAVVGHEQSSDSWTKGGPFVQMLHPSDADLSHFLAAIAFDKMGYTEMRDRLLESILSPEKHGALRTRRGNSMEDLRLSVRGWRLGDMVAQGQLGSNKELANWIAMNVAGG